MRQHSNILLQLRTSANRVLLIAWLLCVCQGLPTGACRWNLGSLAYFILWLQAVTTLRQPQGRRPMACPATWPTLVQIRQENPHYGVAPPAVS